MSYEELIGSVAFGPGWRDRQRDLVHLYQTAEEQDPLVELRDRIFLAEPDCVGRGNDRIFREDHWIRVIIRGSMDGSDRSEEPDDRYEDVEYWRNDDPRDELLPLLQVLYDDDIDEIFHMPVWFDETLAFGAPLNLDGLRCFPRVDEPGGAWLTDTERLLFDRTGRWGLYASCEEFGLLGGEPALMHRYVEKAGGWGFVREKADKFWQMVVDDDYYEANMVDHYYKLAGWDDPPRRREA